MSIEGKVALVTGATRGIGKAIASELGRQGAVVVGTATSEKGAATISEYLAEAGVKGTGMVLDVASSESVESVLKAVQADFGAIEVLVNNAGITRDNIMMDLAKAYPDMKYDVHKGYGTALHLEMIDKYGINDSYRMTFKPIRERFGVHQKSFF